MNYFIDIGFERYTKKFEITKETYDKYNGVITELGWKDSLKVDLVDGTIVIKRNDLKYFRVSKEA
ncbi:hypothetical protein AAHH67_15870 [Niallia circulans]|uniref:hypothetical protein n=1 Tax=Niallia sp. FSL M8-0099 TaxID=2954519 RepID=UPI0030F79722